MPARGDAGGRLVYARCHHGLDDLPDICRRRAPISVRAPLPSGSVILPRQPRLRHHMHGKYSQGERATLLPQCSRRDANRKSPLLQLWRTHARTAIFASALPSSLNPWSLVGTLTLSLAIVARARGVRSF